MDIGGTNIHASTYAMKKAIDMPKLMLNLVQQIPSTDGSLNTESPDVKQTHDIAATTGKGRAIDIVA